MSRRGVLILVLAVVAPSLALADERWTFCVARDLDGGAVWLSAVFATDATHDALEAAFKAYVERFGANIAMARIRTPLRLIGAG